MDTTDNRINGDTRATAREFTVKSVCFGLFCLLLLCAFPAYSLKILGLGGTMRGYLPVVPLFLIIMLSCVWNMVAGRLNRRCAFGSKELAVIYCLMLFVAWIPGLQYSLVRHLILPRYEELSSNVAWKDAGVTVRLPAALFPAGETGSVIGEKVHFGFIQGGLKPATIPFAAWVGPLLHWIPLLTVLSLCLLAMSFLVHRQWVYHEQLRYPLASVADALICQDATRPGGKVYRNRLFWSAFIFVFCFHLLRYLYNWFPNRLPQIPVDYNLGWVHLFPIMGGDQSNAALFCLEWMTTSFAVIGIAFFVPSDVSLSIGLTAPLGTLLGIQYYLATSRPVSSTDLDIFRSGGFIAFGLIMLYTGRTYYFPVLWKALVPGPRGTVIGAGEVWAARLFVAAYVCLIAIVSAMGFDFLVAWIYVTFLLLIFLVMTRLVCETGIPLLAPQWSLPGLMTGLFGPAAIGAAPLVFMSLLSKTISDSTELAMPYMATGLKILDDNKVRLRRFAFVALGGIVLVLAASFIATIAVSYTKGEGKLLNEERDVLTKGVESIITLNDTGQIKASDAAHGFAKIPLVRTDGRTVSYVIVGLVAVLIAYILRFRFSWWPLHPLFFILLGTWTGQSTWCGFLLGWGIKSLVIRFGGGRMYNAAKPLFIGLIVGEFMCLALSFIVGYLYHLVTGGSPRELYT